MDKKYIAGYTDDEWRKLEKEFQRDYQLSTIYNKSFSELISDILKGETYMTFANKTHLSENMLYRLKKQVAKKTHHREIRWCLFA